MTRAAPGSNIKMSNTRSKLPLLATLAYALVGSGWIIIGFFISSTIDESGTTSLFELYKGLAFIAVTGGTLFLVLRWMDSGPVADVVESMGTHRPYRPALGLEAALKEILAHSGSLYDPQVVTVTLRLFRERGYRLPE